jgi:hypothetical protein
MLWVKTRSIAGSAQLELGLPRPLPLWQELFLMNFRNLQLIKASVNSTG